MEVEKQHFSILYGFLSPDLGEILLNDNNLNDKNLSLRTKLGISYLPQEASIFRDLMSMITFFQ